MGRAFEFVVGLITAVNRIDGQPIPLTAEDLTHDDPIDSSLTSDYDTQLTLFARAPYIGTYPIHYDRINLAMLFENVSTVLKIVDTTPTSSIDIIPYINQRYGLFFDVEDIEPTGTYLVDGLVTIEFTPKEKNVAYLGSVVFTIDPTTDDTRPYDLGATLHALNGIELAPTPHR